ncbi:MAG TPA: sulfotransferase [Caulobacteraceae bacterium]
MRLLNDAAAHAQSGRVEAAIAAYRKAERADPADFRAPYSIAVLELGQGRPDRAAERLRRVVRLEPALFPAWHNLGAASQNLEAWGEAAGAYEQALALRPEATETRRNLALVLAILGRTDDAIAHHRTLAAASATRAWALTRIALLRPAAIDDADLAELRRATDAAADLETRIGASFALGEVLEQRGETEAAFAAFAAGNALKHAALDADPATRPADVLLAHQAAVRAVIEHATPQRLAALAGGGVATARPIFVVGMPRSGSTLVEQILAAHPAVQSLGETGALPRLMEAGGLGERPREVRRQAETYLEAMRARGWSGGRPFVDKTLENYLHVGAIAAMFPSAVILHAVRDRMDTCLSCWRQLFSSGAETLYDLGEIGAEYVGYRQVMDHWRAVLPGRVIDVDHEALVANPEARIRWLVTEACGLDWNDATLRFYEAQAPVRTASAAQVRQPIFTTSLQRWRRYEAHLGPLIAALRPYAPEV